ncbi:unnamed protein product [Peniophora sp. CBMAI 1063]|nr:unnamed protein product [Peniophora sp. CBMAI 1063]
MSQSTPPLVRVRRQNVSARHPPVSTLSVDALWSAALEQYRRSLGVDLRDSTLTIADKLDRCSTAEDILDAFQDTLERLHNKRKGSKRTRALRDALKPVVYGLAIILDASAETASSLGVPGGKGVFAAIAILLKAADSVSVRFDDLMQLFDRLGAYVRRLQVRVQAPMSSPTRDIAVQALVEALKALALATQMLRKNRVVLFLGALGSKSDAIRTAIEDLETVVSDEERMAVTDVIVGMHELSTHVLDAGATSSRLAETSQGNLRLTRRLMDEIRDNESRRAGDSHTILELLHILIDCVSINVRSEGLLSIRSPSPTVEHQYGSVSTPGLRTDTESELTSQVGLHRASNAESSMLVSRLRGVISRFAPEDQDILCRSLYTLLTWSLEVMNGRPSPSRSNMAALAPLYWSIFEQMLPLMCTFLLLFMIWKLGSVTRPLGWPSGSVIIIGLCDEIFVLEHDTFSTWENTHAYLSRAFQGRRGATYVARKAYSLGDSDHLLIGQSEWSDVVRAGSRLHMSIVVREKRPRCPYCGAASGTSKTSLSERGRVVCSGCGRIYGTLEGNKINEVPGRLSMQIANSALSNTYASDFDAIDSVSSFHRVLLALDFRRSSQSSLRGSVLDDDPGESARDRLPANVDEVVQELPNAPYIGSLSTSQSSARPPAILGITSGGTHEQGSALDTMRVQAADDGPHVIIQKESDEETAIHGNHRREFGHKRNKHAAGSRSEGRLDLINDSIPTPSIKTNRSPALSEAYDRNLQALDEAPTHVSATLDAEPLSSLYRRDYDEEEKDIIVDSDGKVYAGTVPALVKRLVAHECTDTGFTKTFLMSFKSFTEVDTLVGLLVERFWITPPRGLNGVQEEEWRRLKQHVIRTRVLNTMKTMLLDDDILEEKDMHILDKIVEFARHGEVKEKAAGRQLLSHIQRIQHGSRARSRSTTSRDPQPTPIFPRTKKTLKLLDLSPLEIARQLTIIEGSLFLKIKGSEFFKMRSHELQQDLKESNITAMIETTFKITHWVADAVLKPETAHERAFIITHFIRVADRCRELNNFNSMIAIVSGLSSPPVRRLSRTWDQIIPKHTSMLSACEMTIDSGKEFSNYRRLLQRTEPPCVPFIGFYLMTLMVIQESAPNTITDNLINFRKRAKAVEVVQEIQQWQSRPFNFARVELIAYYLLEQLNKFNGASDVSTVLWDLSLEREPTERQDEKMSRLLQETGFI